MARKNITKKTIAIYWHHSKRYPYSFALSMFLLPLNALNGIILQSLVVASAIDRLNEPGVVFSDLHIYLWSFIGLSLLQWVSWRAFGFTFPRFEMKVMRDIERRIFNWLSAQPQQFHIDNFGGALVAQSKRFVGAYERIFDSVMFGMLLRSSQLIFGIIALLFIMPIVGLFMIAWTAVYLFSITKLSIKKSPLARDAAANDSKVTARLADVITNILTVKMFGREAHESEKFDVATERKFQAAWKDWKFSEYIYAWQGTLMVLLEVFVLYVSIQAVIDGTITLGQLALIQFFLFPILGSLHEVSRIARNLERAFADAAEMTEILHKNPSIVDVESPIEADITSGTVSFKDVDFKYSDKSPQLLQGFNLDIAKNEKIGLVGPSGGGKTSITKLLLRFMDIQGGTIEIDGKDIAQMRQSEFRKHVAYVPQDPTLFHRTLAENISYGMPDATMEQIIEVAKRARAHDFIENLPLKYDTLVGERGVKLSGGERQRVAIARALLKDAPLLVLDEATSALDSESEKLIQEAFEELMSNRTAIVVAHRLSTIQKMDRIVVMQTGEIIEEGNHAKLLKKKGLYAQLWNHQSGGFIEE